jgi:hypothetical protein
MQRSSGRWLSSIREQAGAAIPEHSGAQSGIKRAMPNVRRFQLDELTIRPGTYFNPQTEVMIVVDDSPEVDHELFEMDELNSEDWVLIADDTPVDEQKRDELVERFQQTYQAGAELLAGDDVVDDENDELDADEDEDELEGVDEL